MLLTTSLVPKSERAGRPYILPVCDANRPAFFRSCALSRLEKPTSVRLPPDLLQSVRRAANEQGCAVSFKIAQILREWEVRERRSQVRKKRIPDSIDRDPGPP